MRIQKMLEQATRITWQETDSEIEALILESQLIKKHRSPFNVMLRDDKQYFYIGFSNEQFPRVIITHQPARKVTGYRLQVTDKKRATEKNPLEPDTWNLTPNFLGPYTDGQALKITLRLLRRIFPYCTCKQKHNNYCLNYHIGKCAGLCCLKQQSPNFQFPISNFQKEYRKNIKAIKEILSGKRTTLIKTLKKEMEKSAKKENFEEAANLRDKIEKLEKVFENARILRNTNLQIRANATNQNQKAVEELKRVLELSNPPRRIEGYDVANIQGRFATGAMVVFTNGQPDKNQYRKFKIRGKSRIYGHHKSLGLAMSQNQDPSSGGDTAMLKEMLTRRFNHPEWPRPDLIVVDGGKAQLNVIKHVTYNTKHKKKIPIIALTKDNKHRGTKIFTETPIRGPVSTGRHPRRLISNGASKKAAISLSKLPPAVHNLILRIDSEAHRFAIGYYRKLHRSHGI